MPILNKGISKLIAVTIVFLLALAIGGIVFWQYPEIRSSEREITEVDEEVEQYIECMLIKGSFERIECFNNMFEEKEYNSNICERGGYDTNHGLYKYEEECCYVGAAIAEQNEELCDKAGDESSLCRALVAIEKGDLEEEIVQCEKLISFDKNKCYRYIFEKTDRNEALCEKLISDRDVCYFEVGETRKEEKLCLNINDEILKRNCLISAGSLDESLCEELSNSSKVEEINCYYSFAILKKDKQICENIEYKLDRENCRRTLSISSAMDQEDEEACENIDDYWDKNRCYKTIAISKEDEKLCKKAGGEEDSCFSEMSFVKMNKKLCDKTGDDKDDCYSLWARMEVDEELCEKTGDEKDNCYYWMASIKEDIALCKKTNELEDYCYINMAAIIGDETICEELTDSRGDCYYNVAIAKEDPMLCEKAGQFKIFCDRHFEKNNGAVE